MQTVEMNTSFAQWFLYHQWIYNSFKWNVLQILILIVNLLPNFIIFYLNFNHVKMRAINQMMSAFSAVYLVSRKGEPFRVSSIHTLKDILSHLLLGSCIISKSPFLLATLSNCFYLYYGYKFKIICWYFTKYCEMFDMYSRWIYFLKKKYYVWHTLS